jgi:hypothetical protein
MCSIPIILKYCYTKLGKKKLASSFHATNDDVNIEHQLRQPPSVLNGSITDRSG